MATSRVEDRLKELGMTLPGVAAPVGSYVPGLAVGNMAFSSGQLPFVEGQLYAQGRLGDALGVEAGQEAAKRCALNALAALREAAGNLDRITRVIRVVGYVNSAPDFTEHHLVMNGASDLIGEIFGELGSHTRTSIGVAALPLNAPVEVEMTVAL